MKKQYEERLTALRDYLNASNVDIAVITTPKNIFYYTGFNSEPYERFMALVIDNIKGEMYLLVPALDQELALESANIQNIIPISDEENPYKILQEIIGDKIQTFGLEEKKVTLYQWNQLTSWISFRKTENIEEFIIDQRMRKTEEEGEKVQRVVHLIEQVLADGIKQVRAGMTELDLTAEFEYLMRKSGASGPAFATTVLSGEKSALPHGSPGTRTFQYGDFILIDMGVILDGYCSDISRTFVLGEETAEQKKIYETVKKSTEEAVNAVKIGNPLGEVDKTARDVIKEAGFGQYFNNRVGHGLGIDVHEEPSIHSNNELKAEEGFLFTIEPGIYIPGLGGVRIEENVYIEPTGKTRVLTSYPRELIRLG
ncbi:M24 family metallopeptidase [Pseudalkalibacillus sp. A8]|uniref:M24 family metallopeptidase n=1 Tax=Pseudalkalibacillus sp. A8 TaxID=3382641 RepID=UPI0038B657C6